MQVIKFNELKNFTYHVLIKFGFSTIDAELLANHLATSHLLGYHSHGIVRLPIYYQAILSEEINPKAKISHENLSPTIAFVNGNANLGQLASHFAANLAIEKAKTAGIAAVGIYNVDHTGRLGAFVQQIAEANMLGLYFCNGNTATKMQAPYGGKDPKLSSNPIAFAAPRKSQAPIVLDMATTAMAHGKVLIANDQNEKIPSGYLLDKEGNPTTNPLDYLNGGSLLPFGGSEAYKGFGLALMVEIFAGVLSRAKMFSKQNLQDKNAGFMMAFNIENFLSLDVYYEEIEMLCNDIKSSDLRKGFEEILLPGERAYRTAQKQSKEGILIDKYTWDEVQKLL